MAEYSQQVIKAAKEQVEDQEIGLLKIEEVYAKKSKIIDWLYFALAYLHLARLGCDYILNEENKDSKYKYLVVGVLYNFKHSLELMVKIFTFILAENYKQDHSLKLLFDEFKKIVNSKLGKTNKIAVDKLIDQFYVLIYNYYYLKFLGKKIKMIDDPILLIDAQNTFLKYPENNVSFQIDYWSLIKEINNDDVTLILGDVNKAEKIFSDLGKLLQANKFL